ncbi:uncharacterized protein LOC143023548 isoform X2 [Oratosquilla oratoria]|uniref:uncharacterized protein LOC143023548 isoform X2 n=1 Tax=Oratosquilla oratoria TaxID=337810 RepID=UPI003F75B433
MGCGLTVRLDDSRTSPSLQSEFTDDTSATSHSKPKVYHWDDYDMRECGTLLTGGGSGGGGGDGGGGGGGGGSGNNGEQLCNTAGAAALSTFAPVNRNNFSAAGKEEEETEGMPLLPRSSGTSPRILSGSGGKPDDPLLSNKRPDVTVKDDVEDEQCSFEEILLANNISLSSDDLTSNLPDHKTRYNIISDLEEDPSTETGNKISNVPGDGDIHDHPLSQGYGNPQQHPTRPHLPDVAPERYGSPRSRRPFQRKDYARVSDVSFLSNLEETTIDPSDPECDFHDSGHNTEDEKCCTDARLDSSLQEYFL